MQENSQDDFRALNSIKRENKNRTIPLRVTNHEYASIKSKATLAGLSVSEYLRKLGTGHPVQARFDKDEKRNLQGIGTNLNQLAAFANKGYFYQKSITEVLEELKRILKK
ncbi:plasmid mobilization protein [Dyadobacter chenhuakuii]|uniref:Plasmid mobilization relaxosome protein MobC n=1 Tax=Dyadobacter chenhuakuii TaxID=2909339 RepID=A0ABY4XHD9_9BACT|nr:plasmid mobilization relaxosome protein MobC [Dyadobacter chenhuakuii]MCF2495617.1 plasmid mobilization relaxosome protein MobC [Dyadobacter chenhuakuii]USJ29651.1 plasmid mobilization relaxosome protein MobC [Dyadobacter chenhuakuii]